VGQLSRKSAEFGP